MSLRIKEYENLLQEKYFLASLPPTQNINNYQPSCSPKKTDEYPSKL